MQLTKTNFIQYLHCPESLRLLKNKEDEYPNGAFSLFLGKTSIKNVLPILEPQFSYSNLEIQNGTMALDTWGRLVLQPETFEDIETVKKNLLEYCKLDTLAMVKIYQKLNNL